MRILLIYPRWRNGLWSIFIYRMPPLALYRLANLTPDDFEVEVVDENVNELDYKYVDLVGISSMTPAAPRAYEIADRYRAMGATVVLGGIHPSTLPDEAGRHAHSVVVGEADEIWPVLLQDFQNGRLKSRYVASARPTLLLQISRRTRPLIDRNRYVIRNFIQTGRGCPVNCNFCSVTAFNGAQMRYRRLDDIVSEIIARRPISKYFLFADDNLVANNIQAKQLFEAIAPLDIRWGSQVTIKLGMDDALLKPAVKSGCRTVFIGLESIDQHILDLCEKGFKVEKYETAIKRLHDHGVFIICSFIFGFDGDTPDVIKRTLDFALRNRIDMCQFTLLTPFPDTRLYPKFLQEGRITSFDWSKYDAFHAVFKPARMTQEELQQSVNNAYKQYFAFSPTVTRLRETLKTGNWKAALLGAKTSWDSYRFDI